MTLTDFDSFYLLYIQIYTSHDYLYPPDLNLAVKIAYPGTKALSCKYF